MGPMALAREPRIFSATFLLFAILSLRANNAQGSIRTRAPRQWSTVEQKSYSLHRSCLEWSPADFTVRRT